jgi:hypothetical protein
VKLPHTHDLIGQFKESIHPGRQTGKGKGEKESEKIRKAFLSHEEVCLSEHLQLNQMQGIC